VSTSRPVPRPDKQRALLDGALRVFARDGYSRASIGAIAAEAGVSTRTIYNHYEDKAALFEAVIVDSAERTAQREIAVVQRLLGRLTDLQADLVQFGHAWSTPDPDSAPHFALVRQISADAGHIPPRALAAWQDAGPLRVRFEIAGQLRRLADRNLLDIDDEQLAANQLIQLTAGTAQPSPVPTAIDAAERDRIIRSGIAVFLAAYRSRADHDHDHDHGPDPTRQRNPPHG